MNSPAPELMGKNVKSLPSVRAMVIFLLFLGFALLLMFPLFWMVSSSFKDKSEIFLNPPVWVPTLWHWENYTELFTDRNYGRVLYNSFFASGIYTFGALFFCSLAGFAFAKYNFKGKAVLFLIVLGSTMVPAESGMIPLFVIYRELGLIDNIWGIILPGLANAFGIFFMRQYCSSIHDELLEAARVDGCTEFRIFFTIALPNIRPAMASLGIIFFVNQWNNFLWPMVILRSAENMTIAVAIRGLQEGIRTPYHLIMSASVVSIVPLILIVFLFQKQLISGLMDGSLKG